jgi:malate dehydrogenase (oxaloacetate-decarboxylating)
LTEINKGCGRMALENEALELHRRRQGKIETGSKVSLCDAKDLCLAYTPGVAEPCKAIAEDRDKVYEYTCKGNMVAVVTDGTAVLGLGNIGPEAALPVMEGKALLFKAFAGVDAFPVCLNTKDVEEIVRTVQLLEPVFGGINLEDIAAPRCFQIEEKLKESLSIPVFHDDQHGTAIVVLAALINALRVVGKEIHNVRILINGDGAAGTAIARLLLSVGVQDLLVCGRHGALCRGNPNLNEAKASLAADTNSRQIQGPLLDVIADTDVFIGVSAPQVLTAEMVAKMAPDSVVLAMANPVPEIWPSEAMAGGARIVGTGRSDFPNQVNNVLAFPGVFRGALEVRATTINEEMKKAAAYAIAELVSAEELNENHIMPEAFDPRVAPAVAAAVAEAAIISGVARRTKDPAEIRKNTRQDVDDYCRTQRK